MKKYYIFIFLVFKTILYSQNSVQLKLVKTERIKVDNLLGVDRFDSYYYLNNNAFEKKQIDKIFSYTLFAHPILMTLVKSSTLNLGLS